MLLRGLVALFVSVLAASVHSAVLPAQYEHLVVATDHPIVRRSVDSTTEIPYKPIKKTEMRVRSEVALRYARTSVITHVANPDSRPQEATFRMLLPDTAFISGFTMTIGEQSYTAYVKGKQEAKQIYSQAVSQGSAAALVATKARNSNHFTVSVNVEGNTTAIFDLRYEDFLVRRNGLYSHVINLHPGALVPVMEVVVHIKESQQITKLNVPELRTGNEIDATKNDARNPMAVIQNGTDDKEVTVTFTPDLKEQRRLAKLYLDKSSGDGTALGQFVVEYDVERSNDGEILVNDGYFVHFLAPTSLPALRKHVVFVLDTSGSMYGREIDQLRKAMDVILSELNPYDYFNIIEFNSDVKMYELEDGDEYAYYSYTYYKYDYKNTVPPAIASPTNIAKAKAIVSGLESEKLTDINSALDAALSIIKAGVRLTDNKNHDENRKLINQLEPMIIFLTDGQPVEGETDTDRIIELVTEKNTGDMKAALYSLAFGDGADRDFLRKLSLRNDGFMRHIYEAADAALQLQDFYRQVSSPLLANVKFTYPANQIIEGSVSRNQFRTINKGSEAVVVGKVADDVTEMTSQIDAYSGANEDMRLIECRIDKTVLVRRIKDDFLPLERLWAYLTIKQLLDKRDAGDHGSDKNSPEKMALDIALKYSFVTPLTSLVVVKPNETVHDTLDVESVDNLDSAGYTIQGSRLSVGYTSKSMMAVPSVLFAAAPMWPSRKTSGLIKDTTTQTSVQTTVPSKNYHLEGFEWTSSLLNVSADALTVRGANGEQVSLKLTTDINPPVAVSGDVACSNSTYAVDTSDETGSVCVYVTRCYAARSITADDYQNSYCVVNNRYAGICCPEDKLMF
ncbi:inter-alpha-trypsin inhibitor heavy chain H3 [Bicyclus anynana]|uniref:Inter-alpha-trypsin inhibitor heavy chain H3 n=1 Tax=Bicyclus anynana TaxID=110368 RepID=A0A6J1PBL5_BICAN|nr:inter-alpha-trypsin inhibitor heavy chain H3 [Bicyclus anynana]